MVAALLAGGLGLPIPEELALVGAGYWLSRGVAATPMIACALAAVLAGDAVMLLAGRCGARLGFARRCLGAARLAAFERSFARHGALLLVCGRFIPGVRATLLVAAGAARVPLQRVVVADGAAALVGVAAWIAIGWELGPHVERARALVGDARGVVLCAA
ncbi:MAG: putative DedA protein family, partial [bacterium]|nr:putative DedA protein family [bacterium]